MESECFTLSEHEEAYTNQQLFTILDEFRKDMKNEMSSFKEELTDLKEDISDLKVEMARTTTLIRDYNGLRAKLDDHEKEITKLKTSKSTEKETKKDNRSYIAWLVAVGMFILAIADRFIQ